MPASPRPRLSLTAGGLLHITAPDPGAKPTAAAESPQPAWWRRPAAERGRTDLGWLQSFHSFSFGSYYDQRYLGFRSLRVINDDRIAAGRGFPTHPHRNMEILSYVLDGALQHRDSTGHGATITPDAIQMMSAGTGITHSEFNPSATAANHFLQIWIEPALRGLQPRYRERRVTREQKRGRWQRIASPTGDATSVAIQQDLQLYATDLLAGETVEHVVEQDRHVWLQVARGAVTVNGICLTRGDALATSRPAALHLTADAPSEALLFDLG